MQLYTYINHPRKDGSGRFVPKLTPVTQADGIDVVPPNAYHHFPMVTFTTPEGLVDRKHLTKAEGTAKEFDRLHRAAVTRCQELEAQLAAKSGRVGHVLLAGGCGVVGWLIGHYGGLR